MLQNPLVYKLARRHAHEQMYVANDEAAMKSGGTGHYWCHSWLAGSITVTGDCTEKLPVDPADILVEYRETAPAPRYNYLHKYATYSTYVVVSRNGNVYSCHGKHYVDEYVDPHTGETMPPTTHFDTHAYVTNSPITPFFEKILLNALAGLGVHTNTEGINRLLDMNRKYYHALVPDPNHVSAAEKLETVRESFEDVDVLLRATQRELTALKDLLISDV